MATSTSHAITRIAHVRLSRFAAGAAYVKDRFVPIAEATIPVTDWGFTRSDVVYDVVHVWKGAFFRLEDHLDRFERSMAMRRLKIAEDRDGIADVLHHCVGLAGLTDAFVAMVATRGRPRVFGSRRPADCENYLIAYAVPWIDVIPKDVQARGAHLWIAGTPRVPDSSVDPTIKNYQWSDLTSGILEAHDEGFDTSVNCDAEGFVGRRAGLQCFRAEGWRGEDAGSRQPRRHHAEDGAGNLRKPRHSGCDRARHACRTRRGGRSVHHLDGRRHHAGVARHGPYHGQ